MKIGIIIGSLGFGGAERVSTRLAQWWHAQGLEVSFYTTMPPPEKEYSISSGIQRYYCHQASNPFGVMKRLRRILLADKPDVVIVMDTPMCVFAVPALLGTRVAFVVSERSDPKTASIKWATRILSRSLMHFAHGFIFQTHGAREYFSTSIQKRSVVLPNPLMVRELPSPFTGQRKKTVAAVGRLIPAKNYPLLIQAFTQFSSTHPEYTLEIYGDGSEKERIARRIMDSPVRHQIHLMGTRKDVLDRILDAGIFVLSSDFEGMPNALLEAMALGIPSISTDCPPGGPSDLINHNENGLLIPVGNAEELCKAMCQLADDPKLCNKLSQNSLSIRNRLDIEIVGAQWLLALQNAIRRRARERKKDNEVL